MFNFDLYLTPFLTAFTLSVLFIFCLLFLLKRYAVFEKKVRRGSRHIHKKIISRLGGVAIFGAFLVTILVDSNLNITKDIWGILAGAGVIFLIGIWDDISEINWKIQLLVQSVAVIVMLSFGNKIINPLIDVVFLNETIKILISVVLFLLWSLILINAMNWVDGVDGLSGGISLIAVMTIFLLSLKPEVNQPPVGILAIALAGAILAFLIFNFYPAKIMAGSSGIFLVSFILASLSIFAGTKVATTLLVLAIPVLDFFWVIWKRFKSNKSIFSADQEHLHHKLMLIGWSQRQINLFFYGITLVVAGIALTVPTPRKIAVILIIIFVMALFYRLINKRSEDIA